MLHATCKCCMHAIAVVHTTNSHPSKRALAAQPSRLTLRPTGLAAVTATWRPSSCYSLSHRALARDAGDGTQLSCTLAPRHRAHHGRMDGRSALAHSTGRSPHMHTYITHRRLVLARPPSHTSIKHGPPIHPSSIGRLLRHLSAHPARPTPPRSTRHPHTAIHGPTIMAQALRLL